MRPGVVVQPTSVTLAPGAGAAVTVRIVNASSITEHYQVEVTAHEGVVAHPIPHVELNPGESQSVTAQLDLMQGESAPLAGSYILGVVVSSRYRPDVRRAEELRLNVTPEPRLTLTVDPTVLRSRRHGIVEVDLHNIGNAPLDVDIDGRDPEGGARVSLSGRHEHVPARGTVRVTADVVARRPFSGKEIQRRLTFSATSTRASQMTAEASVQMTQQPLVRGGALKALTGAVVAAVAAVGLGIGLVLTAQRIASPPGATPSTSAAPSPSQSTPGPSTTTSTGSSSTTSSTTTPAILAADFSNPPPGVREETTQIDAGGYPGLTLSSVGGSGDCAGSGVVWARSQTQLRFVAPGRLVRTTAGRTGIDCQNLGLRVVFASRAASAKVGVVGLGDDTPLQYSMQAVDNTGQITATTAVIANGETRDLVISVPEGRTLVAFVLSPSSGASATYVGLTRVMWG